MILHDMVSRPFRVRFALANSHTPLAIDGLRTPTTPAEQEGHPIDLARSRIPTTTRLHTSTGYRRCLDNGDERKPR